MRTLLIWGGDCDTERLSDWGLHVQILGGPRSGTKLLLQVAPRFSGDGPV